MKKINFTLYDYYFALWYDIGSIYRSELSEYYASVVISLQYTLVVGIGYKLALIFNFLTPVPDNIDFIGLLSIAGFIFLIHFFTYILTKRFRDVLFIFEQKKKKNRDQIKKVKIFLYILLIFQIFVAMYLPYNI